MRWSPRVTVAAIVERDNKFLIVEEEIDGKLMLNQPAGHWEHGETLLEAVIRETLEETAWEFTPTALTGIYQWQHPEQADTTFLRFAFCGEVHNYHQDTKLDEGIIQSLWLSREELIDRQHQHRSPQLLQCIDDYLINQRIDLSVLKLVE